MAKRWFVQHWWTGRLSGRILNRLVHRMRSTATVKDSNERRSILRRIRSRYSEVSDIYDDQQHIAMVGLFLSTYVTIEYHLGRIPVFVGKIVTEP